MVHIVLHADNIESNFKTYSLKDRVNVQQAKKAVGLVSILVFLFIQTNQISV